MVLMVLVLVGGGGGSRGGEIDVPREGSVGCGEEARLVEGTGLLQVVGVGMGLLLLLMVLQLGQRRRTARRTYGAGTAEAAESRLGGAGCACWLRGVLVA